MIIKRKYATYGQLYSDEATKNAIESIFEKYNVNPKVQDYILDPFNNIIVLNTDMESGIPGEAYLEMRQALDELDSSLPFDNKLTYRDVSDVFTIPSRKGAALMQIMFKRPVESAPVIVQVIAFEYRNGETIIIEPWDIDSIIL